MDILLSQLASANGGYFTRGEALDSGLLDRDLRSGLRAGTIIRLRHGAYVPAADYRRLEDVDRHAVLARAVVGQQRGRVALTGPSAAAVHGLSVYGQALDVVHLVRLDRQGSKVEAGVKHHRPPAKLLEDDLVSHNGVLLPKVARTVWEVASMSGLEEGVCTADSARRRNKNLEPELIALAPEYRQRPGSRVAKLALTLSADKAESEGESITRVQCFRFGIPNPTLQFEVLDAFGRLIGRSDFEWEEFRHLGEFDGKVKYLRYLRAGESPADAVFREKKREDSMRAERYGMSRFVWANVMPSSAKQSMGKLWHDLQQSRSLYTHNRVIIPL